jgi:hypothetical protein
MEAIKNLLVDCLNGFSLDQIPLFFFQLLVAGLLAHVFQLLLNKKMDEKLVENAALIAVGMAVLAAVVKYNEPFAILGAAVILILLKGETKSKLETLALVMVLIFGVTCGIGSVVLAALGALVIYALILFTPLKK